MIASLKIHRRKALLAGAFFLVSPLLHAAPTRPWREVYQEHREAIASLSPLEGCSSAQGEALLHYEKKGHKAEGKRILVLSLIHGNEIPAGHLGFRWVRRLLKLSPSNSWFIVPVLNPDAVAKVTRTDHEGVDLNRNFPTMDWETAAHSYWKHLGQRPEKFPGTRAAQGPVVQCVVKLIDEYRPDLIVSIHTPFAVLDYDGPAYKKPRVFPMPWKSLGHYPGSLGRYAWAERGIPVLTVELPPAPAETLFSQMERFQDELSFLAR